MIGRKTTFSCFIVVAILVFLQGCSEKSLKPWHTEKLTEEFSQDKVKEVQSFVNYLQLEDRLFKQLDEKVYAQMAIQGERGLLLIPSDWMLRLRYNPFYDFLESRTLDWVDNANDVFK